MNLPYHRLAAACALALSTPATAQDAAGSEPTITGSVTITGGRPSSLPVQIPATIEGIGAAQIEQTINAMDSEDALKYMPSLLVRKRFIGDYNHAVLSTRASGTGNSARSMVYADGILLSNYLGNGAGFTPRWGLVTPEEIERVNVLYGPFSAAHAGNSAGAVIDYVTRMPTRFEAHAKLAWASQHYALHGERDRDAGKQASASLGKRSGRFAWWFNLNRLDSEGQPLAFPTRLLSEGAAPAAATPVVSGALAGRNPKGQPWWLLGSATRYRSVQEHAKLKLGFDITPTLRASYTLGWWKNQTAGSARSYLRDAAGHAVHGGDVVIEGRQYDLDAPALAFAPSSHALAHLMQGLSLKTQTRGVLDWEVAASRYAYLSDRLRAPTLALPAALDGGPGRITDMDGSGWRNLHLRATWRPAGQARGAGSHIVEFGFQQDAYRLRTLVSSTGQWNTGDPARRFSAFNGDSALRSIFAQDTWTLSPRWKATFGGRAEHWVAERGKVGNAAIILPFGVRRSASHFSPKAALAWRAREDWVLKVSAGRAVRMPTVGELFQGSIVGDSIAHSDPALKPEKSWTGEISAEREEEKGSLRATLFAERTRDALYSQALPQAPTVFTVQNIGAIHTRGIELAWQRSGWGIEGLDLNGSLSYTHSRIHSNPNFPASAGKRQPRVPDWRASAVATWRHKQRASYTLAARYSGKQYGQLDNSDFNGFSYQGFSKFFVVDARLRFRLDRQWSAALGIDNLNNYQYWAFHPYTQRTVVAELKFEL